MRLLGLFLLFITPTAWSGACLKNDLTTDSTVSELVAAINCLDKQLTSESSNNATGAKLNGQCRSSSSAMIDGDVSATVQRISRKGNQAVISIMVKNISEKDVTLTSNSGYKLTLTNSKGEAKRDYGLETPTTLQPGATRMLNQQFTFNELAEEEAFDAVLLFLASEINFSFYDLKPNCL